MATTGHRRRGASCLTFWRVIGMALVLTTAHALPVTAARALVSLPPMEGFLHPHTDLDTLGYDRPETTCTFD